MRLFSGIQAQDRESPRVKLPDRDDLPITTGVSDNYFDLLAGEPLKITLKTSAQLSSDQLKSAMQVVSLTDAFPAAPTMH